MFRVLFIIEEFIMKKGIIYKATSPSGKVYIGQTFMAASAGKRSPTVVGETIVGASL